MRPMRQSRSTWRAFCRSRTERSGSCATFGGVRSGLACPTHILFNGGVMKADALRTRLVEVLNSWLTEEGFAALESGQCAGRA